MKKNIAIILTILMAASTLTACSQANGVSQSSVNQLPKTAVSATAETEENTSMNDDIAETVTAETSAVADETQPSTTEPSKPKKTDTSQNLGKVEQISEDKPETQQSSPSSNDEHYVEQQKSKSDSKPTEKPKSESKPKAAEKPKSEITPKPTEKPKPVEKPTEAPKPKSVDRNRVTSTLIGYGKSLGMKYDSSLNIGNSGWFPPLDISGYSDTNSLISAGYAEVDYVPYYFSESDVVPSDIAFNVIVSNNQLYIVYG